MAKKKPKKKPKKKVKSTLPDPLKASEVIRNIKTLVSKGHYVFDPHAEARFVKRNIQPLQVLEILKGALTHDPSMNEYSNHFECWTYAVFGRNKEFELKVVTGVKDKNLLIITVVKTKVF